jgi:hypothetical protein
VEAVAETEEPGRVRVEKQRWKRSFSVHAGAVSELATSSEPVPRQSGCDAKLTLLTGPDMTPWWTLGFEAYGELHESKPYFFGLCH